MEKDIQDEDFEELMRISFIINEEHLKQQDYEVNSIGNLNGLKYFGCESIIYTNKGVFYVPSPNFGRDGYEIWDVGLLDVKNCLFYELSVLTKDYPEKNHMFGEWIDFLQLILDEKLYGKLFEYFSFDKGIFSNGDRLLYEPIFFNVLKKLLEGNTEFAIYLCDVMRNWNKMISYDVFRNKLGSNLKNFAV